MAGWENLRVDLAYTPLHVSLLALEGTPIPPWVAPVKRVLGLTADSAPSLYTFFVPKGEGLEEAEGHVLRHLAGVARLRLLLGVPPDPKVWAVDRNPVHLAPTPDALWYRGPSPLPVAVEYDVGYRKPLLLEKLWGMASLYPEQIWGAPTWSRVAYLRGLIPPPLRERVRVYRAPWA